MVPTVRSRQPWVVRIIDPSGADPQAGSCVYVETPDSWGGNMVPAPLAEAVALAGALLAAVDMAVQRSGEHVRLLPVRPVRAA